MTALKAQKKRTFFIKNPSFPVRPDSGPLKIQYPPRCPLRPDNRPPWSARQINHDPQSQTPGHYF